MILMNCPDLLYFRIEELRRKGFSPEISMGSIPTFSN